jgi:hypothetical protein
VFVIAERAARGFEEMATIFFFLNKNFPRRS